MNIQNFMKSIDACAAHYGEQAAEMKDYLIKGSEAAMKLPNRGPIKFDDNGDLAQEIREAYSTYGFYIFEGVLCEDELADVIADLDKMKT